MNQYRRHRSPAGYTADAASWLRFFGVEELICRNSGQPIALIYAVLVISNSVIDEELVMDRQEIQANMEAKIAQGEVKIEEMKAKLSEAGDAASDEAREALAKAESMLESGKQKMGELANASDDKFNELAEQGKASWDELSGQIEGGWASVSDKVKEFFS